MFILKLKVQFLRPYHQYHQCHWKVYVHKSITFPQRLVSIDWKLKLKKENLYKFMIGTVSRTEIFRKNIFIIYITKKEFITRYTSFLQTIVYQCLRTHWNLNLKKKSLQIWNIFILFFLLILSSFYLCFVIFLLDILFYIELKNTQTTKLCVIKTNIFSIFFFFLFYFLVVLWKILKHKNRWKELSYWKSGKSMLLLISFSFFHH